MELFIKAKKMLNSIDVRGKYTRELVPMYNKIVWNGFPVSTDLEKAAAVLAVYEDDSTASDLVKMLVERARAWGNTKLVRA